MPVPIDFENFPYPTPVAAEPVPAPIASPTAESPQVTPYQAGPLVPYKGDTSIALSDAALFAHLFMAIDNARSNLSLHMSRSEWNNDMARAIEQLKNTAQGRVDDTRSKTDKEPKGTLPQDVADYLWNENIVVDGVPWREKVGTIEEGRSKEWTVGQLQQVVAALENKKTEFTDSNSKLMQLIQIAWSVMQVIQSLTSSMIEGVKRTNDSIASKT